MQKKSQLVSFLLTFFLGPFGLLYVNVVAFFIMFIVTLIAFVTTLGAASLFVWLITIVIGALLVNSHNEKVDIDVEKQKEIQEDIVKKAIEDSKQKDFIQKQMIEEAVQARLKDIDKN